MAARGVVSRMAGRFTDDAVIPDKKGTDENERVRLNLHLEARARPKDARDDQGRAAGADGFEQEGGSRGRAP
jgi:hypothetical protein